MKPENLFDDQGYTDLSVSNVLQNALDWIAAKREANEGTMLRNVTLGSLSLSLAMAHTAHSIAKKMWPRD